MVAGAAVVFFLSLQVFYDNEHFIAIIWMYFIENRNRSKHQRATGYEIWSLGATHSRWKIYGLA